MNFIGDYFALGLIIVLSLFFFDKKYYLTTASKFFMAALGLTAATALIDLIAGRMIHTMGVPLWLNMATNSLYFVVNILTTSAIALYLFTRILEHSYDDHCMTYAKRGLAILLTVYLGFVVANLWTGCLFYFDEAGMYQRGTFNGVGYFITICQMCLVMICYIRNRKNAGKTMRRVLLQILPVAVLCIIVQRIFPDIMLNGYIMAMADTVIFLNFHGQRQGIHSLTKLNDRHRFFREIEVRMAADERFQAFLINIKNFNSINQKYGHKNGDELLYQFAFALEKIIKNSAAFHMNGTEFALLIPYTWQKKAQGHCGTLLQFLDNGIEFMEEQICLDYIVAEYVADDPDVTAEVFYERLEYAADLAEQQNCPYICYTSDIGEQMDREYYFQERIKIVDRDHGFQVWYQPVYCLDNGKYCSMEALIRLQEPDGRMVSPGEFIPLAEDSGIITAITWFVVEESCRLLAAREELSEVNVSINLPMAQMLEPGFATRLNSIVDRFGVSHQQICLEFTEREILGTFEQTRGVMQELRASGYRFFLDDFGTGYSNYSCMLQLPFHTVKLDASLVRLSEARDDRQLLPALTKLLHDLGAQVVAEGVEDQTTVEHLTAYGVDRIQGYFFAKPMEEKLLLEFYQKNPIS